MELLKNMDVVRNISKKDFSAYYDKPQKPVIIKGLTDDIPARNWTFGSFKRRLGDLTVGVYDNANPLSRASAYTRSDHKIRFGDYLDILASGAQSNLRIFLFNLFKYEPRLREEFPCPDFFSSPLDHLAYMFFGTRNTKVRIHYDIDMSSVLHTQFTGRKRVVLIAPEFSRLLYKLPFNTYSLIDFDNPDLSKYPALRHVKYYDLVLDPGDTVFMPSGYWHYMTYLDNSFSVSYRKPAPGLTGKMKGILNMSLYMPIDKLMNLLAGGQWLSQKELIAGKRAKKTALSFDEDYVIC